MSEKIKFVRIQDELHHIDVKNGELYLNYPNTPEKARNTLHFAVNALVEDHAYGKFNYDSEGHFKGKIVIITDPSDTVPPSHLNQVDTWFRLGLNENNEKSLNVGKSLLVLPLSMKENLPHGVNALFYNETIESRNEVVENYFKTQNIALQKCGFRAWVGQDNEAQNWAEKQIKNHYVGQNVKVGLHDNSVDDELERASVDGLLKSFKEDNKRTFIKDSGEEILYVEHIEKMSSKHIKTIQEFLNTLPSSEKERLLPVYENQINQIKKDTREAFNLDNTLIQENIKKYLKIDLHEFKGVGDFFIAKPSDTHPTQMNSQILEEKILTGEIHGECVLWRQGYKENWVKISSTALKDTLKDIENFNTKSFNLELAPETKSLKAKINHFRQAPHDAINKNQFKM